MEFPLLVYKKGGPHFIGGGTFSYEHVVDETALAPLLAAGWSLALEEAMNGKPSEAAEAAPKRGRPRKVQENGLD